jgi:hypothetical protein
MRPTGGETAAFVNLRGSYALLSFIPNGERRAGLARGFSRP